MPTSLGLTIKMGIKTFVENFEAKCLFDRGRYADAIAGNASPNFEYNHNPYPNNTNSDRFFVDFFPHIYILRHMEMGQKIEQFI